MHRFIDDHPIRPNVRRLDQFEQALRDDPPYDTQPDESMLGPVVLALVLGLLGAGVVWLVVR